MRMGARARDTLSREMRPDTLTDIAPLICRTFSFMAFRTSRSANSSRSKLSLYPPRACASLPLRIEP
jgi:hypothetical protein